MTTLAINRPRDRHRPAFHFTPPIGWMNDANGLSQIGDTYHLFYQSNPYGPQHNRIHWGHAVSKDLVHWEDRPIALIPKDSGPDVEGCWSGVLVKTDEGPAFVYSGRNSQAGITQTCCLAWPNDKVELDWFEQDPANPVIAGPPAEVPALEMRDHCVWREGEIWHQIMGAGLPAAEGPEPAPKLGALMHFVSKDFRSWDFAGVLLDGSQVEPGEADAATTWECPDIFEVPGGPGVENAHVPGRTAFVWSAWHEEVTLHSAYILGERDSDSFTPATTPRYLDLGLRHFYAPQSLRLDDGRHIQVGWSQEGLDDGAVAQSDWFGAMALPRELWAQGDVLHSRPVPTVDELRTGAPEVVTLEGANRTVLETRSVQTDSVGKVRLAPGGEVTIDVLAAADGSERTRIRLARGAAAESTEVTLGVDRSESRAATVLPHYDSKLLSGAIATGGSGEVELRVLVDHSIIEVFANGRPLTARAYPACASSNGIAIETNAAASVSELSTWEMAAAEQPERSSIIAHP